MDIICSYKRTSRNLCRKRKNDDVRHIRERTVLRRFTLLFEKDLYENRSRLVEISKIILNISEGVQNLLYRKFFRI